MQTYAHHWFPETLSSTRDIELFSSCEYKWFLQRILHFTKYSKNVDLEAGSEFAKANEITRTAYFKENLSLKEAVKLGVEHILTKYAETFEQEKFQDSLKTPNRLAEVFQQMYDQTRLDELTIIPFEMEDGALSVEQEFVVELPFNHPESGKPLKLKCLLDLLGIKDGTVYVMDDKTCKSVLKDRDVQADLLRTQNQFVQYVTVGNKCNDKFGGLQITHVRINRCKIKAKYEKNENVIEPYDFEIDLWFQKTWWNTLLAKVERMLTLYKWFISIQQNGTVFHEGQEIFLRSYGLACTSFFKPCIFTYHCTSGTAQDLQGLGFKQIINNSTTKGVGQTISDYRKFILEEIPFPEKEETVKETYENHSMDSFLETFL